MYIAVSYSNWLMGKFLGSMLNGNKDSVDSVLLYSTREGPQGFKEPATTECKHKKVFNSNNQLAGAPLFREIELKPRTTNARHF